MNITLEDINSMYQKAVCNLVTLGYEPHALCKPISWNKRKKEYGSTYKRGFCYWIEISKPLAENASDMRSVYDTVVHETIHTISGCMNHGGKWKRIVGEYNRKFNTSISRCSKLSEDQMKISKYLVRCTKCGTVTPYYRMCKTLNHLAEYRCALCGGELERSL